MRPISASTDDQAWRYRCCLRRHLIEPYAAEPTSSATSPPDPARPAQINKAANPNASMGAEELELPERDQVDVLLGGEVDQGEGSSATEQQAHSMSLPRGDIRISESEPALGALPGTNPQFAVNIGPRRSTSVRRKAGDLLDMIGGDDLAAEVRDSSLHRLLPAG